MNVVIMISRHGCFTNKINGFAVTYRPTPPMGSKKAKLRVQAVRVHNTAVDVLPYQAVLPTSV